LSYATNIEQVMIKKEEFVYFDIHCSSVDYINISDIQYHTFGTKTCFRVSEMKLVYKASQTLIRLKILLCKIV